MSLVRNTRNPIEMQDILSYTFQFILNDNYSMTRATTTDMLFKLREVSTCWREVADHLKKQIKCLSLLPLSSQDDSNYYFTDLLHAKLFEMRRYSYLGPLYSRFFTSSGNVKSSCTLRSFLQFYPNVKYLCVVELNTHILNHINMHWPQLRALSLEALNVSEAQLTNCTFRSSLQLISFGAKVNDKSQYLIFSLFNNLHTIHYQSTSRSSYRVKRIHVNLFTQLNSSIRNIYFGTRLLSIRPSPVNVFDSMERNSHAIHAMNQLEALELLQCDFQQIDTIVEHVIPKFNCLKKLSLDVTNVTNVDVLTHLGKLCHLKYLALNLPHGCQVKGHRIPLKQILNYNNNLCTLILTGHYEYPVIDDIQLYDLLYCHNLTYICIYAIVPTSLHASIDYISLFGKFYKLQVLHIDYLPLSQSHNRQLTYNFWMMIGCKLKSFSLICWCCMRGDYDCCDPERKESYITHERMCYCIANPPDSFFPT